MHNNACFRIRKLFYIIVNGINFRNRYDYSRGRIQSQVKQKLANLFPGSSDNGIILDGSDI